jgi:hypothetical protein
MCSRRLILVASGRPNKSLKPWTVRPGQADAARRANKQSMKPSGAAQLKAVMPNQFWRPTAFSFKADCYASIH